MAIHPVIMCGGAGTRLWPVSNQAKPKQFHALVSDKSVFQETVLRFAGAEGFSQNPLIISNAAYAELIAQQLDEIGITPRRHLARAGKAATPPLSLPSLRATSPVRFPAASACSSPLTIS